MLRRPSAHALALTGQTLAVGAVGAGVAELLRFPIAVLTGPALAVALCACLGLRTRIDETVRAVVFLLVGVSIGSGVDTSAASAMLRWPLAFAVLGVLMAATLWLCGRGLARGLGIDRRSAYLAAAPGHLSFVVGLSEGLSLDTTRIVVIQSIRLLALTLTVPLIASALGMDLSGPVLPQGAPLAWTHLGLLLAAGLLVGFALDRFGLPAPVLIGGMLASSIGHGTGWTPGTMAPWLGYAGLMVVGALIGSRFDGITRAALTASLLAGLSVTAITVLLACAAALPVAYTLGFDPLHVLVAFAPGGLETMIAMGVALGADPGFVAAAHVARLLFLTLLLPLFVGRLNRP